MYYICGKKTFINRIEYGVMDTKDGVVEYYTKEQLDLIVRKHGLSIKGYSRDNIVIQTVKENVSHTKKTVYTVIEYLIDGMDERHEDMVYLQEGGISAQLNSLKSSGFKPTVFEEGVKRWGVSSNVYTVSEELLPMFEIELGTFDTVYLCYGSTYSSRMGYTRGACDHNTDNGVFKVCLTQEEADDFCRRFRNSWCFTCSKEQSKKDFGKIWREYQQAEYERNCYW